MRKIRGEDKITKVDQRCFKPMTCRSSLEV